MLHFSNLDGRSHVLSIHLHVSKPTLLTNEQKQLKSHVVLTPAHGLDVKVNIMPHLIKKTTAWIHVALKFELAVAKLNKSRTKEKK